MQQANLVSSEAESGIISGMDDYPKELKRRLRELAAIAHERAIRVQLGKLAEDFQQWQRGAMDSWELSDRIHRFHDGANRDLFVQYTRGQPAMMVAHAIASGLLQESEVALEVREAIARLIEMQREWAQETVEESDEQS
jgi:hypothetical protein